MSYEDFFDLKDSPFRLTPDPDYFFPSGVHKETLDTMVFSITSGEGFVLITGNPGVGKTLLVRTLLRQMGDRVNLALVLNPTLSPRELLWVILDDLGVIDMDESEDLSKEKLLRLFRNHVLQKAAEGLKTTIIIDEAQNLPRETLEELRMLSNLESDKEKLLQIILVGQLELEECLRSDDMKQLAQRISVRCRLQPLTSEETGAYVRHRLEIAGGSLGVNIVPGVMCRIHSLSRGIPRRINLICERAMMAAYVDGEKGVTKKHLVRAIRSIEGQEDRMSVSVTPDWLWPSLVAGMVILAALWYALDFNPTATLKKDISQARPEAVALVEKQEKVGSLQSSVSSEETGAGIQEHPEGYKSGVTDPGVPVAKSAYQTNARVLEETLPAVVVKNPQSDVSNRQSGMPIIQNPQSLSSLLPADDMFLAVDKDEKKARLWQGTGETSFVLYEFQLDWRLMEGLFILGSSKDRGAFIFNPLLFQWGGYNLLNAAALWDRVSAYVTGSILPVIVYSGVKTNRDLLAADARVISDTVTGPWAQSWRQRNTADLMSFYGSSFTSYSIDSNRPQTYSKAELSEIRGRILAVSSSISLKTSEPVSLIDPQNPDRAIAVFRQEYMSSTYMDKGTKVLYLQRDADSADRPWKITAKFFLPEN